ncbi:hypothetical protein [Caulobacter sp. S45]|uniref:hypothetical protein n=1 Tax=Caulobacter sp. S45 TaxID=1641861 RepID=UPI00131DFBC4|nr:hypothetical protein [Caulobacter sp. S45]
MKTLAIAAAAAAMMLTAAPAFASPASVVPDTAHNIVRGTGHIVKGTYRGVAHQVGNAGYAVRSTGHSIGHGVRRLTGHHHRHHYVHTHTSN